MLNSVAAANPLTNLLPGHTSSWWPLVGDVFSSRACATLSSKLLDEAVQGGECAYLSRRWHLPGVSMVISVRGRSGAVLGLLPAVDESAASVARCLEASLPAAGLCQVLHVATDNPSAKLSNVLQETLPPAAKHFVGPYPHCYEL